MEEEQGKRGLSTQKERLYEALLVQPGVTLVFGAVDAGKSTLTRDLAGLLSRNAKTALVDLDVGQSSIGPPACSGACMVRGPLASWNRAERIHFVGNFSPRGHFLQILDGLVRLIRWAQANQAAHVLVDTTGYVSGAAALELKYHKVALARPSHLVFLERDSELSALRDLFRRRRDLNIHLLKTPGWVPRTDAKERRERRFRSLSLYLRGARRLHLPLRTSLFVNPYAGADNEDDLPRRLVGCLDSEGETLALGVLRKVDSVGRRLEIETPLRSARSVKRLRLGWTRLQEDESPRS